MKLSVKGFALTSAILCGLAVFVLTLLSVLRGTGEHLGLLAMFYIGYQVSYIGSLIGLAYGFLDGLVGGALFAWLYNRLAA